MTQGNGFDADLIRRYDVNGPRYTSYPTANLFSEAFPAGGYRQALQNLPDGAALSLYLHVPFCATVCYYCACNRIITANRRHAVSYLAHLDCEIAMISALLPADHAVEQLHFGGGTPTYLNDAQFTTLFATLRQRFRLKSDETRDFSIEIDPRTVTADRIRHLIELGINRMSLGVQDFDPAVQHAVNRIQSVADTREIIQAARDNGIRSVSIDLIYGLPLQNRDSFARTLATVLDLAPDRISLYSYAHLPERFKTQRQINVVDLPRADAKLGLLELAVDTLCASDYVYVGMDHFARHDDSLVVAQREGRLHRNFQGYTTHSHCELIGLGVSAISSIDGVYAQNAKDLTRYGDAVEAGTLPVERGLASSAEDRIRRDLIGTLMCQFRVDIADFAQRHGIDFTAHFARAMEALAALERDGLVEVSETAIEVTARGRFLVRNVCMAFDAYLAPAAGGFSKAI
ncbi:MAG: oxygen-independent coproporphyrinogen III oxidase [Pseudomonadales bacterium]